MLAVPVDTVSTEGLESSPVAEALAGVRASEARYFSTEYGHTVATHPADEVTQLVGYVTRVLAERDVVIASRPLEASSFEADGVRWTHVIDGSGLLVQGRPRAGRAPSGPLPHAGAKSSSATPSGSRNSRM